MALLKKIKEKLGFGTGSTDHDTGETTVTVEKDSDDETVTESDGDVGEETTDTGDVSTDATDTDATTDTDVADESTPDPVETRGGPRRRGLGRGRR